LFVGKTLLHGDVLMWLMKTLLTSGCTNQRGAGQFSSTLELKNLKEHLLMLQQRFSINHARTSSWKWHVRLRRM
ncbi:hypothetical protein EA146_24920, partial [Enterobacter hormaechei]